MPFKSKKQEEYLRINEPEVYQDWKEKYGSFKEAQGFDYDYDGFGGFARWKKRQSERRPPMFLHPSENYWDIYEDEGERKALFIANRITQYMNEVLFEAFTRLDEASKEKTPKQMKSMAQRQANLVWKKMQNYMERYASMGASDSGTELRMVSFINQFFHEKGYENVNVDRYKLRYGRGWGAEEFEAERIRYDYTVHREPKGTEIGTDGERIPNPKGGRFTSASDNRDAEEFAAYVSTDTTRRVRGELKRAFPNMKFSVSKKDGTLRVAIMQGDLDFRDLWEDVPYDKQYWRRWNDPKPHFDGYVDINTYHTDSYNPKYTSVFNEIVDIMKGDEWFDNSDAQIDYFHTAYYLSLTIGKRDRDYIYTGVPRMSDLFRRAETFEAEMKMHPDWCSNCGMKDDGCINLGYGDWYCMNFLNNRETYDGRYDRFRGETFEPTYEERMNVSYYFTFEPKEEGGGQTLYRTLEDAQKAVAKMEKPLEIFEYRNMDDVGAEEREKQKQDHLEWSEREKTGEFFEDFWWKDEMSRYRNSKDPYLHHSTNESSPEMDEADGFYEEHILPDNPTRSKIRENESYAEILGISERLSNLLNSSRTFGMYITQRTHPKTVEKYRQKIIDGFDNYTPQSDKERTIMKIVRNNVATRGLRGPQPSYYSTSMGILRKPELSYTYSDYYSNPVPFMGYELTDEENKIIGDTKKAESETFEARDCVDIVSNFVEPSRNYYRVRFRNPKIFVGGKYTTPQWGQRAAMTIGKKYYGVSGCKITMAQPIGGRWVIQNVLIPKQGGVEMDEELALKIANHIQDRIEREGKWASVICRDRGSTRYVSRINNQHIVRDERGRFAPHAAEAFGAESFRVGDEGMFEGGEVRITRIEEPYGQQKVYFFTNLDESGNSDGFIHTVNQRRFENQFSMFPRDWNAEEFGAEWRGRWDVGNARKSGEDYYFTYYIKKTEANPQAFEVLIRGRSPEGREMIRQASKNPIFGNLRYADKIKIGFFIQNQVNWEGNIIKGHYQVYLPKLVEGKRGKQVFQMTPSILVVDNYGEPVIEGLYPTKQKAVNAIYYYFGEMEYPFHISNWPLENSWEFNWDEEFGAEEFGAEGGEPIYVVKRDYTGAEIGYLIGTESYILKEMGVVIDVNAYELDIDYEDMSLEEIFDTVFEYSDEYGPELIGKFTDGMYVRLKSYDADKDVGFLAMFDGGTIDYAFDLSRIGFKHESNAEEFGAEGYIDDGLIWEMRDRLEPPAQGYVMFASSSPEVNIPYLLDKGYDRDEIIIVEYGGNETIWIPNTPPLKRAEEFGADGR